MAPRRLVWQLYPTYVGIVLAALLVVAWYSAQLMVHWSDANTQRLLESSASLAASQIREAVLRNDNSSAERICRQIASATGARLTIVLPGGDVFCDSAVVAPTNAAESPGVAEALAGQTTADGARGEIDGSRVRYASAPVRDGDRIVAAVRSALPESWADAMLRDFRWRTLAMSLTVLAVAAALSWFVARAISRPLDEIRTAAERFAQGELRAKLPSAANWEMERLAESLNAMAVQLEERLATLERKSGEQEAILSSMTEGVLAVDAGRRVFSLNAAAAKLLGAERAGILGRGVHEVVRHPLLRAFIDRALQSRAAIEEDLELGPNEHERVVQARSATLRDPQDNVHGAVIVLKDVSRMRQLETMRTDFAANVSHELKTPITSIKGFVETLLDGAMRKPEDCERFLTIVAKQSDRLNAIIDDLLSLARIEEGAAASEIVLEPCAVKAVLEAAVEECQSRAEERQIVVDLSCSADVRADMNAALLEQAVANLIDNAVKYSEPGSRIEVRAARTERGVSISVRDSGCGIPAEHIPRLFERFYRVDKARSRKLGGTGLGLAIVKHIVYAHRGRISVDSTPGEGSTFTIHLPLPAHRPARDASAA